MLVSLRYIDCEIDGVFNIVVVDSFFVGKYSEPALTALSVIYPLQLIIIALAVGTGVGVNTYMARLYAQKMPGLAVGGGILNSFGGIVGVIGSLALLGTALMNVVALYKLACAYGHGIGFTIGLFFLNPLFMLILGFGDSEYMGPQE